MASHVAEPSASMAHGASAIGFFVQTFVVMSQ
jgi:hypothetical protein